MVVTPGHSGGSLDTRSSVLLVKKSVLGALNDRQSPTSKLTLPGKVEPPRVTSEALQEVDSMLGTYSTSYASSSANRANNVVEAAKALNHVILLPGDTFSFNRTVGPRSVDTGFLEAPVIVHGKMETGIGGGICQVSTTLYNAVLLANLKIVTRNHHSLPSHYVPTGLDATVSYGSLDFCFANNSSSPIVIESKQGGGRLSMSILGKGPARKVQIERTGIKAMPSDTVTQTDPTLPLGKRIVTKGRPTKEVTVYRVVDGERELISHDRYSGEPTIVRVGSAPLKTPPVVEHGADQTPASGAHNSTMPHVKTALKLPLKAQLKPKHLSQKHVKPN
jgi:vancomycin resistance protein YoaR